MLAKKAPLAETPYSVAEVAALTGFSRQTVTRLFEDEPGVRPERMHKKPYRSIRVPRPVFERVVRRHKPIPSKGVISSHRY